MGSIGKNRQKALGAGTKRVQQIRQRQLGFTSHDQTERTHTRCDSARQALEGASLSPSLQRAIGSRKFVVDLPANRLGPGELLRSTAVVIARI